MISFSPYLVYNGDCEEAFNFYKTVFGCESLYIGRYKDVPDEARKFFPNANAEHVMHATLQLNERTAIMGNDNPDIDERSLSSVPRDFYIYLDIDLPEKATRVFNELSDNGQIIVPIAHTFWCNCYGAVTDKFGINWKVTSHGNDHASTS